MEDMKGGDLVDLFERGFPNHDWADGVYMRQVMMCVNVKSGVVRYLTSSILCRYTFIQFIIK